MSETTFTNVRMGRSRGYGWSRPKWRCDVCGRTGYDDLAEERGRYGHWSDGCKRGHAACCWCGRMLSVRQDGTPRVHARCPDRPDGDQRAWDDAKEAVGAARTDHALGLRGEGR